MGLRILAIEPFYGGSHRAFLDGWRDHSRHPFTVLGLPACHWKWRMRGSAVTFAEHMRERIAASERWDVLFCSDMLDLAAFRGLAPPEIASLPTVVYLHENQLIYPVQTVRERDEHFGFTNITTALAATRVWFNSAFHRDAFLGAVDTFLRRMPDHPPQSAAKAIAAKCELHYPGVDSVAPRGEREPGPLRILWAARWEHDKGPETFFEAIGTLRQRGTAFRLSVLGQQFPQSPPVFETARLDFAEHIDHWGYLPSREAYAAALAGADVMVSTARHEFFGLSVVEAISAGAYPLLPDRLAYPEVLTAFGLPAEAHLYDGSATALAERLNQLARRVETNPIQQLNTVSFERERFAWRRIGVAMDDAVEDLLASFP